MTFHYHAVSDVLHATPINPPAFLMNPVAPGTLVAMVSLGDRTRLTDVSFPRAAAWAARHHYSAVLIKERLQGEDRLPYFGKLKVPERFPGFERYCIVDDDVLVNTHASALPVVPPGMVGLVPDAEQRLTTHPKVKWTGNTGFILFGQNAQQLLSEAYARGEVPSVWPFGSDQSALNAVLWERGLVHQLDQRWNFQAVLEYFLRGKGWDAWKNDRIYRLGYYARLWLPSRNEQVQMARKCWCLHMIRGVYPSFFDKVLP